MSWFSELTSKAEAMLVKLDQDAAQALQNPDNILQRSKLHDKTVSVLNKIGLDDQYAPEPSSRPEERNQESDQQANYPEQDLTGVEADRSDKLAINFVGDQSSSNERLALPEETSQSTTVGSGSSNYQPEYGRVNRDEETQSSHKDPLVQDTSHSHSTSESPSAIRKFKLQTSTLRQPLLDKQKTSRNARSTRANGHAKTIKNEISLGADDIRASINRSLQEYSASVNTNSRNYANNQTTYTSHFDDQPNLIQSHHSSFDDDNNRLNDRLLSSSPSFSINLPDTVGSSTDIADQIMRQSALKKKSTFNLHKVINKLAGNKAQSQAIFSDKTKIRLRRAQLRAASYLRRLNYYFRAYPTMKYWMLGYIVILQLLVVYVLFFYQSSGSSSYLASQVKQQQAELVESLQSNSEKINPSASDSVNFT